MRGLRHWLSGRRTIEQRLRAERPRPPRELVRVIAAATRSGAPRRVPARGAARVAALSAVLLVGLLAVGGLGYAMTAVTDAVVRVATHAFSGTQSSVRTLAVNAANDQYSTTTTTTSSSTTTPSSTTTTTTTPSSSTTTTTTPSSSTTTTTPSTSTNASTGEVVASAPPASTGSINVSSPGATVQAAVTWTPQTFTQPVTVKVNPTPPLATPSLVGSQNQLVSVTVTTSSGQVVHSLPAPLDIVFKNPVAGFVPVISEDGINFRAVPKIAGPPLPDADQDGYYVDSAGAVHILTRHLTVFAVLYKANVTASETGRRLAAPGSGKFGDPTRIHVGPPALSVVAQPTLGGKDVQFTFFVDEQVAAYFHVSSGSRQLLLRAAGSTIRGHTIGGTPRKTLHVVILRPGTIRTSLLTPGARSGDQVVLTVVDYDGHKVTKTLTIG